jgi:hypothetical protein
MNLNVTTAQREVCPGSIVVITASGEIPDGAELEWSVNGEAISQGRAFEFGTAGRNPGTYTISLKAAAPEYNDASASASVNLLPYRAPSGNLQVSPSELWVGERATVISRFSPGQCGGSLRAPVVSATEGSIRGGEYDSSGVQFDPSDNSEQRKTVTLHAEVADERGEANAEATVVVKKKAVILAKRLPDIVFPEGSARVNNCGKRVLLEELRTYTDRDPTGQVVFVGHVGPKEKKPAALDRQRALNAAAVISAGQGVCARFPASQILVSGVGAADNGIDLQPHFCGTSAIPRSGELQGQSVKATDDAKYRRVEVWFVPTGGVLPTSSRDYQQALALSVSNLGCPK